MKKIKKWLFGLITAMTMTGFSVIEAREMPAGELRSALEGIVREIGGNSSICKLDVASEDRVCGSFVQTTNEDFFVRYTKVLTARKAAGVVEAIGGWTQSEKRSSSFFFYRGVTVDVAFSQGSNGGDFIFSTKLDPKLASVEVSLAQLIQVVEKFFVSFNLVDVPCSNIQTTGNFTQIRCGLYKYKAEVFALDLDVFFRLTVPAQTVRPWDGKSGIFESPDGSRFHVLLQSNSDMTLTVVLAVR